MFTLFSITSLRKEALIVPALICSTVVANAQNVITGTVVDETNTPLIGVSVKLKKAGKGVITDMSGKFNIKVGQNATLVFSYIGYQQQEVKPGNKKSLNIKLVPDNAMLDELVVVGYGAMRKSDLTGSVSGVDEKKINNYKSGSVVEALGGQIPGVQITASDGTPGSGFDIKIRGIGTVNGDSSPLYIVDGFEVDNIDYLANADIEKIDVLKDASASAIYGARAANGVVLVTTKSGKIGKPVVTYNGSASYRKISKTLDLISPYEFVKLQMEINPERYATTYYQTGNDSNGDPYRYQSAEDYRNVAGIDWQGEAFRPTWSQNHDISITGGTKTTQYAISYSHFDEDGIFVNSGFKKNTGKMRFKQQVTKAISLDATLNYANTVKDGIGTSGSTGSLGMLSNLLRARPTGGLAVTDEQLLTSVYDPLNLENNDNTQINPIIQAESVKNRRQAELWGLNFAVNIEIIKNLIWRSAATYNTTNTRTDVFYGENSSQAYRSGGVYGSTQMQKDLRWSNSNTLTYKMKINKKNSFDVMLGHEVSYRSTEFLYGQAKDFPFENLGNDNLGLGATPSSVNTGKSDKKLLSFFARGNYNYGNRYLLTATIRADGSTVFSKKNKWGYFPSFSAAWRVSEEKFMKNVKPISNLKVRFGWGTVGNDRVSNFLSLDLYTESKYGVGNKLVTVLTPKQLANKNLKWEGQTTTNLGIDIGLFKNRVNLSADFYVKNTKDLLLAQNLAYVTGFSYQWQNIGKIQNKGIELNLNTTNIQTRNFLWQTDFNISFLKNTLESLQDGTESMYSATSFNSNFKNYDYVASIGQPLGQMYGYIFDGVYQTSDFNKTPDGKMVLKPGIPDISTHAGKAVELGMVKYKDLDGDGEITTSDRTVIGHGYPKWYGGITNTFNYKGVDLSILFQFTYGNDIYNANRLFNTQTMDERSNQLAEVADRWTPTNASNRVPSAKGYVKYDIYSRFIEDGSFLRLKNITLGYTFPSQWTKKVFINRLRVYGTAQNLFCLTKYSGYDPEVNMKSSPLMPGFDWGAYPKSRVFTFGVEVQF